MPKRRDTDRRTVPPAEPVEPPEQAEVERAIEMVVERLKPKTPKGGMPTNRKPRREAARDAGPRSHLSLVWDRSREGA